MDLHSPCVKEQSPMQCMFLLLSLCKKKLGRAVMTQSSNIHEQSIMAGKGVLSVRQTFV